jgi:hypothetical protein
MIIACGFVFSNSVTVPVSVRSFCLSNITKEWCALAGADTAVIIAAAIAAGIRACHGDLSAEAQRAKGEAAEQRSRACRGEAAEQRSRVFSMTASLSGG